MKTPTRSSKVRACRGGGGGRGRASCSLAFVLADVMAILLLLSGCAAPSKGTFKAPEQASNSLIAALRANDIARVKEILGPGSEDVISSGDAVADKQQAQRFVALYDEKHALEEEDPERMTLLVGKTDWPFPIPIVHKGHGWAFDTEQGKDEILSRRIGRNELFTIQVCQAIVDAQLEYAMRDPDGDGLPNYARKLRSDPGARNGLYWETGPGEPPSPMGDLVAAAEKEGYAPSTRPAGERRPFHGYYYRFLTAQGPGARGGARDYLVKGKLLGGFGILAYPAEYGNSGIMSFVVNQDGIVYQKDLGPDTDGVAQAIQTYDPGDGWTRVEARDAAPATAPSSAPAAVTQPVAVGAGGPWDDGGRAPP